LQIVQPDDAIGQFWSSGNDAYDVRIVVSHPEILQHGGNPGQVPE
jgi:hypothetical protein